MTISTLLVANRGEIARRIFRTTREMGLRTVAVYGEPDIGEPYVREADVAVALDGAKASETFLDAGKVIDAARRSGADAVHPGYGFLSENAAFARACADAGITFIGPSPEAIDSMGRKIEAKRIAIEAGVRTLEMPPYPASPPGQLDFPLLVKASSGGGGRGMRVVESAAGLDAAVESVRREAESAFGDGTVFLERYLERSRHIEIQVVADTHGNVVHLGERECSIQRNHQKIIEEAPSPVVDDTLRAAMGTAAVSLATAIGYVGAGTVEFLFDDGDFYFLEMNTRLQVEHPVTEEVTGIDLVRAQIEVADGKPLALDQADVALSGHAIETRLYAEIPSRDWMPSFGEVHRYAHGPTADVRYDDGIATGSEVSTYYDPMLAKVITHANTRAEAAARLARALRELRIHGIRTNRDYLAAVLDSPDFVAGDTTTAFVEAHADLLDAQPDPEIVAVHALAATLLAAHRRRVAAPVLGFAPSGWRNVPSQRQQQKLRYADTEIEVAYELTGRLFRASVDDTETKGRVVASTLDTIEIEIDGVAHHCAVDTVAYTHYVNSPLAQTELVEVPRFAAHVAATAAGGPMAPVPGTVVSVEVSAGDEVAAGAVLVVLEAMKMEHRIEAPSDAVVAEVLVEPGENVDAHQVLVRLEES